MPQCKLNDLAFIKKSLRPANVGLIIQCVKYLGPYSKGELITINGEHWHAYDTDDHWVIESKSGSIETQFGKSKIAYIPDSWLTPIKPLSDDGELDDVNLTLADELTS